jgi:hypothetical protein
MEEAPLDAPEAHPGSVRADDVLGGLCLGFGQCPWAQRLRCSGRELFTSCSEKCSKEKSHLLGGGQRYLIWIRFGNCIYVRRAKCLSFCLLTFLSLPTFFGFFQSASKPFLRLLATTLVKCVCLWQQKCASTDASLAPCASRWQIHLVIEEARDEGRDSISKYEGLCHGQALDSG